VKSEMNCPCERYWEREAIMHESGDVEDTHREARFDTCRGCSGKIGVDMLELAEHERKQSE
jgi:predicted metal-binding protein